MHTLRSIARNLLALLVAGSLVACMAPVTAWDAGALTPNSAKTARSSTLRITGKVQSSSVAADEKLRTALALPVCNPEYFQLVPFGEVAEPDLVPVYRAFVRIPSTRAPPPGV